MKRKIFLITLMVALFVCLFAISVSAADIPEWTDVITYETGENAIAYKDGFDTTSRVLLDNGDGTYSTYPTNYIIKGTDATFDEKEIDFTALKTASENSTYTNASIIRIEIPAGFTSVDKWMFRPNYGLKTTSILTVKFAEGITSLGAKMFYDSTAVEIELPDSVETMGDEFAYGSLFTSIKIPKNLTAIPYRMFYQSTNIMTVDFSEAESLEVIGESAFSGCTSLESAILPEGLTTLSKYAFYKSGVKNVYLPSTIKEVGLYTFEQSAAEVVESYSPIIGENMFYKCNNLRKITLENTVSVAKYGFLIESGKTSYVTELVLPETLTTIGSYAFARMAITELYVPASVKQADSYAFAACKSLQKAVVLCDVIGEHMFHDCSTLSELVLAQPLKTYGNANSLGNVSSKFTTYFVGENYEATKTLMNVSSRISGAKVYSYEDYTSGNYNASSNYLFIYDCNICEVAYDSVHLPASAMHEHTSYTASSYLVTACPRCLEESSRVEVAPIFDGFGYSARIENNGDTKRALVFSYFINTDSLDIYKSYNPEKTLSFGIVGAFESKITNADSEVYNPLNADGTAVQGNVVAYDIASKDIVSIDFIIKGEQATWEANGIPSSPIYMLGYVIDDTGLYYIGNNTEKVATQSVNITDLKTVTYNELFTE